MKSLCLGQIPSQGLSKHGKTRGAQLLGAPSLFLCMDYQQRVYSMFDKSHKNIKKNLDKISAIRKEFWFSKTLSHRI